MPRSNKVWMLDYRDGSGDSQIIYVLEPSRARAEYIAKRYASEELSGTPNLYSISDTSWGVLDPDEKEEFNNRNPRVAVFDVEKAD